MRTHIAVVLLLSFGLVLGDLVFGASEASASITMAVEGERSSITFTSDAPGERIVGTASSLSGTLTVDLQALESTTGTLRFPVRAMQTGNRTRDRHLIGREWLNASANPDIVFVVERLSDVTRETDGTRITVRGTAHGQVEVNGVRAPATARVEVILLTDRGSARIQPTFTVRLADHEVRGARGAIGDTVGETIDIEGLIYASWDTP